MFEAIPETNLSTEELERLDQRTAECATALVRKVEKHQATVIEAAERFRRERAPMVEKADPADRPTVRKLVERDVERATGELRRSLVANTEPEREELLGALRNHEKSLLAIAQLCSSPAQMLGRVALGEPRRTHVQQQLTGAGAVELTTAARDAVARRDVVAGAAILAVVDRLPTRDRPFSPADLAEALMGAQHKATRARLDGALERVRAARALNRAFTLGRTDPVSRIERGLAAQRAQK